MNHYLVTVVFQVPDAVKDQIFTMRKTLSQKYKTKGELAEPHITIYQCKIPENDLQDALNKIEKLALTTLAVEFIANGVNIKNEYIGIKYEKTSTIDLFHQGIIKLLNPFRQGSVRSTYVEKRDSYLPEEQQNIDTFGYPYVMGLYQPHIALIALEDKQVAQLINPNDVPTISFKSNYIEVIMVIDGQKLVKAVPLAC